MGDVSIDLGVPVDLGDVVAAVLGEVLREAQRCRDDTDLRSCV